MTLVKLEVTTTDLDLQYEITNESSHDIWICHDMQTNGKWHFEAVLAQDGRTLIVRRRLGMLADPIFIAGPPGLSFARPIGSYVRLQPCGQRLQTLSLRLPVPCQRILSRAQPTENTLCLDRLLLQVGFFDGNLPIAIRHILEQAEMTGDDLWGKSGPLHSFCASELGILSLHQLNSLNKRLDDTTDTVLTPYAVWQFIGENLLQVTVDGLRIPYEETVESSEIREGKYYGFIPSTFSGGCLNSPSEVGVWPEEEHWCEYLLNMAACKGESTCRPGHWCSVPRLFRCGYVW